jgi:molybdate transport system substrate-binding protein
VSRTRVPGLALGVALAAATVTGCAGDDPGRLDVLAAASLTEVFDGLAQEYEAGHPGTEVAISFGSSTDLAGAAADGAPGQVLATADAESMRLAVDAGVTAAEPVPFAANELALAIAPGNPRRIAGLRDLPGTTWIRCADEAPCGRVAVELLARAGVADEPASLEEDVRSTLDKVVAGEADAGLVWASDAAAAGDRVTTVPVEGAASAPTTYWIAPLRGAGEEARRWIRLVTSPRGRAALTEAGFSLPEQP